MKFLLLISHSASSGSQHFGSRIAFDANHVFSVSATVASGPMTST